MTARAPITAPPIPEQRPLPATYPRVPPGLWKRIAQEKVRECWAKDQEIERLRALLAEAKR